MKPTTRLIPAALAALALAATAVPAHAQAPDAPKRHVHFDLEAVQAILAVQGLDGWLLADTSGQNRIARELVDPVGSPTRSWFYFIPAQGQPIILVHRADAGAFEQIAGTKIEYSGQRDLKRGLRKMFKGVRQLAMEYAPKSGIPSLSLVDAATVELVRSTGVKIQSSARLVQFSKSLWGPMGRIAHYVAVHHLTKLRQEALAYLAKQITHGYTVTEHDVQQFIIRGYKVRGIVGPPPVVAAGANAADPNYQPTSEHSAKIKKGDLVLIGMSARLEQAPRPIYADVTWMAYVGDAVPKRYAQVFETLAQARDAALELIQTRVERRRAVHGFEADQKARQVVAAAGYGDKFIHRTGHSLDTSLQGDGANIDDYEAHDTRMLVQGAGFTIEPGVYYKGDFGMRAEIDVYVGFGGVEVTTPVQTTITAILAKK